MKNKRINAAEQTETGQTELEKYKLAYETIVEDFWEYLPKETQKEINKELNHIFGKGHPEYVSQILI